MSAQISHDASARESLVRKVVAPLSYQHCSWCGRRNAHGKLFRYSTAPDANSARENIIIGLFCSVQCMRIYHGG